MQTRGAGDDADGCDKQRPRPWSFSVCIFSYARRTQPPTWAGKVLIDWGCHDQRQCMGYRQKPDSRNPAHRPNARAQWTGSRVCSPLNLTASVRSSTRHNTPIVSWAILESSLGEIARSHCSPVRMMNRRKRRKAPQNKDHKRCCGPHRTIWGAQRLTLQHS
jgi:hypothetical protein